MENHLQMDGLRYQVVSKVQYNEYYPFGMNTANSWTRENTTGNNYLYNAGTELNSTSNVYDLFYRNYDPVLGRMNQVDPMATSFAGLSPYNYSFNDPVTFSDPLGDCPTCPQYQRSDDTWWVADRRTQGKYAVYNSFTDYIFQNQVGFGGETNPWAWTGMGSGDIYGPSFSMYGVGSGNGSISHQEYMVAVEQAKAQGGRVEYHHGRYWVSIPLVRTFFVDTPDDPYYSGYNVTMTWAGREDILVSGGGIRPARNRGSKGKNESAMSAAWAISGVLLLDDGSGVGVADDIVIPFLLAAAFVSDLINDRPLVPYQGNPNYPGPWTTTKPDTTNPFYNSSGNTSYESGDPEGLPPGIGVGLGASIGIMKLMQDHFERKDRLQQHVHPQDATKYVMPRIMPK